MELREKLYLVSDDGKKFMGAGVLWLLENIGKTGSLLAASEMMGMSYTKARGMVENLEKELGCTVIDRKKGGAMRKGATLTPFAEKYISLYREFQDKAKAAAEECFVSFDASVKALMEEEDGGQ